MGMFILWLILFFLISFYKSKFYSSIKKSKFNIKVWVSSFECGFMGHKMKIKSFSNGFFILLVFFVIFDLEMSLLLNSVFQEEFFKNLVYYLIFLCIISFGFLLEVIKGFMKWYN